MWVYKVREKALYYNGNFISSGYSGAVGFKDNPENECLKDKGPIPRGKYTIGKPFNHPKTKAYTMRLTPSSSNNMCGRDAFMIHGDSTKKPGTASNGCIILPLSIRKLICAKNDPHLSVE